LPTGKPIKSMERGDSGTFVTLVTSSFSRFSVTFTTVSVCSAGSPQAMANSRLMLLVMSSAEAGLAM
jgi:hypothetical protein